MAGSQMQILPGILNPRPPSYKPQGTGRTRPLVSPQEVAQAVQEEDLHLNFNVLVIWLSFQT